MALVRGKSQTPRQSVALAWLRRADVDDGCYCLSIGAASSLAWFESWHFFRMPTSDPLLVHLFFKTNLR